MDLSKHGVLDKYGVEMIGANAEVIAKAEERDQFKKAMEKISGFRFAAVKRFTRSKRLARCSMKSAAPAWCGRVSR